MPTELTMRMVVEEACVFNPFEPDVIARYQFEAQFGIGSLTPQQKLMLAVLTDAIDCFRQYGAASDGRSERLFQEARDWIFERDSDWPFSFENICDTLGLDAGYIRRGLIASNIRPTALKISLRSPIRTPNISS
jgi:hypothetical protein